jgi:hypothetical protein
METPWGFFDDGASQDHPPSYRVGVVFINQNHFMHIPHTHQVEALIIELN